MCASGGKSAAKAGAREIPREHEYQKGDKLYGIKNFKRRRKKNESY